jgi:lipopolysaccharide heptosyltransferase II
MGDIVLTTPLVRAVRRRFPEARIDFVIKQEFAELMQTNPHVSTVYAYDTRSGVRGLFALARQLRQNHYDLLIDIHKNFRSYLLRPLVRPGQVTTYSKQIFQRTLLVKTGINRYGKILQVPERYLKSMKPFGVVDDGKGLELFPTETHRSKVKGIFQQGNLSKKDLAIGFGPIASFPLKQWPAEKFIELGQQLVQKFGARILLFGGPEETQTVEQIASRIPNAPVVLCGRLSFLESAVAVQRCTLFVGNDTGMLHIATAMERKVIALFGPTVEEFGYYPYRAQSIVMSKPLSCRPCTHTGKGMCKISTHECMKTIQVAEVFDAVEMMLKYDYNKDLIQTRIAPD